MMKGMRKSCFFPLVC